MSKLSLALIGDVHLSDVPISSRLDDYNEAVLKKLSYIFEYLKSVDDLKAVFFLGDLFHRKNPSQTTHQTISRLINLFGALPVEKWSLVGNHDYGNSIDAIDKQPIFVLQKAGVLNLFPVKDCSEDFCVSFGSDNNIKVWGINHSEENDAKLDAFVLKDKQLRANTLNIFLSHQWVFEDGKQFFGNYWHYEDFKDFHFDVLVNGHYHPAAKPAKVYGKVFLRPGAIGRVTASQEDFDLKPQFYILRIDEETLKMQLITVPIPHEPADKVFDVKKAEQSKITKQEISKFTKTLQSAAVGDVDVNSIESLISLLSTMQNDPEVLATCKKYIIEANNNLQ